MSEGLRLTDILSTATAVANFTGVPAVSAEHLRLAIDILLGEKTLDDLGRPVSPLVSRVTGAGSGATAGVRGLAQEWFSRQQGDVAYELSDAELEAFRAELVELEARERSAAD